MVFISDGAPWIHQWQSDNYPKATQILDFYHAIEHLAEFARDLFLDDITCTTWIKTQKEELKESNLDGIIGEIKEVIKGKSKKIKQKANRLIAYYTKNKSRMDYKTYQEKGFQIGSGAIEAAHRTVIQKRLKQSGQRWTREGAQNIIYLRTVFMSGRWESVVSIIKKKVA